MRHVYMYMYGIASAKFYTRQLAMANTDRKRKRVVLSIESKLSVLDSVAKGVGYSELYEKCLVLENRQSLL